MRNIVLLCLFMLALSASAQNSGCNFFKEGNFRYSYKDPDKVGVTIKRTKTIQTEYNSKTKTWAKTKIEWIDDCTYRLTLVKTNDPELKKYIGEPTPEITIVEVIIAGRKTAVCSINIPDGPLKIEIEKVE